MHDASGNLLTSDQDKTKLLNDYFCSVFTLDDDSLPNFPSRLPDSAAGICDISISTQIICKIIRKLEMNSAAGPDRLPPIFYRKTEAAIANPLSTLYRTIIDLHTLPTEWKSAIITPIFKKGSPSDPANYRPIALTCTCCKILESIIAAEIINFLETHKLITKQQHGFLKKHSTVTNLLESVNDWTLALSNRKSVVIAYIDFRKAFDSVSHPKLLHKLVGYGIQGNLLFWITCFLSDRVQRVRVGSSLSNPSPVTSGVPQGSVIGSLLFSLFINDITDQLDNSTTSKIFADDVKIYTEFSTTISPDHLQNHLDLIHQWSVTWQLPISSSKCNILTLGRHKLTQTFTLSDSPITRVDSCLDLGVTIDSELKFSKHISDIVRRAKQRSALIHRCFLSRNIPNLVRAFHTYVRPLVEYATQIWSPHLISNLNLIESVQRSFTKRLPGLSNYTYSERLAILQLRSLEYRRLTFDLALCFNIVHGNIALPFNDFFTFSSNPSSRGHSLKLAIPIANTNIRKYFFSTRIIKIWNDLPSSIVHAPSTSAFKKRLPNHDLTNALTLPF